MSACHTRCAYVRDARYAHGSARIGAHTRTRTERLGRHAYQCAQRYVRAPECDRLTWVFPYLNICFLLLFGFFDRINIFFILYSKCILYRKDDNSENLG